MREKRTMNSLRWPQVPHTRQQDTKIQHHLNRYLIHNPNHTISIYMQHSSDFSLLKHQGTTPSTFLHFAHSNSANTCIIITATGFRFDHDFPPFLSSNMVAQSPFKRILNLTHTTYCSICKHLKVPILCDEIEERV